MHGSFRVRRLVVQSRNPFASPHLDYKPLSNSDDIQVPKFDSMGSTTVLYPVKDKAFLDRIEELPGSGQRHQIVVPGQQNSADFSLGSWNFMYKFYHSHSI